MSTAHPMQPSGCKRDSREPDASDDAANDLCLALEKSQVLKLAAESFDGAGDFQVLSHELTAEPYLLVSRWPGDRLCPRVNVVLSVQFDALDDSVAEIHAQLAARLHHLAERIDRRAECEVGR